MPTPVVEPTLPLGDVDLVFVDVETTGLYPIFGDRICEIGALKVRSGREVDTFVQLVDPLRPISPGASAVNGITDEMVDGQPTFSEVAGAFLSFVENAILVAHNAPFDFGFLALEIRLAGVPPLPNPIVDTLQVARRYLRLESHALGFLADHFHITAPDAHRALGDCRTTFRVFQQLIAEVFKDGAPSVGIFLDRMIGWSVEEEQTDLLHLLPPSLRGPVKRRERVIIDYVDASGNKTTRTIQLKEVTAMRDYIYLVAYCYAKEAERTFRLDRILRWEKAPEPDM